MGKSSIFIIFLLLSISVYANPVKKIKRIKLPNGIIATPLICRNNALLDVWDGHSYTKQLMRIDLKTSAVKSLFTIDYDYVNDKTQIYDCDSATGNYFFV